jgi:hypothetical protein
MNRTWAAVAAFLAAVPLQGQSTWGGLRFGMTETEVKEVLKDRAVSTGDKPGPNPLYYTAVRLASVEIQVPYSTTFTASQKPEFPIIKGTGALDFDTKKGTLLRISLDFGSHEKNPSTNDKGLRAVAYSYISDQLTEKYGNPSSQNGHCFATRNEIFEKFVYDPDSIAKCSKMWRKDGQSIEMQADLIGYSLFLRVIYKANSDSGL